MNKPFSNIVGPENVSVSESDRDAYSYSAGDLIRVPAAIVWPKDTKQVARILRENNQVRGQVVIRGAGTSTGNATVGERATILSSERMNRIIAMDSGSRTITVESGMRLCELKDLLSDSEYTIHFSPLNDSATIGGLFAVDAYAPESEVLGTFSRLVDEFEMVDATGKVFMTSKRELAAGKEGLSGFVTWLKLKLDQKQALSIDVLQFQELTEMLRAILRLRNDKDRYFAEFIDRETAKRFGFEEQHTLVIAYTNFKGKYKSYLETEPILKMLKGLYSSLRMDGYYFTLDPLVSTEKTYDLVDWCLKNKVPLHGHAGCGLFYAYFRKDDKAKLDEFRSFIRSIRGTLGACMGVGFANAEFLSQEERKKLMKLKDEHDYNNTLNPGKMISYR